MEHHVDTVGRIGVLLLESGAEIYRVEETMVNIGKCLQGVSESQSFVTPTGIMLSLTENGVVNTKVIRVHQRGINLQRIAEINQLSRRCMRGIMSHFDIVSELTRITSMPTSPKYMVFVCSACITFGFALFFNANLMEAVFASLIGLASRVIFELMIKVHLHQFLNQVVSASIIALLSYFIAKISPTVHQDVMIIAGIMLFVPGLAITNAIRDMLAGDYVSFLARTVEAIMIAIAIAFGVGFTLSCLQQLFGGI